MQNKSEQSFTKATGNILNFRFNIHFVLFFILQCQQKVAQKFAFFSKLF